jgi:hypothetical protein
LSPQGRLPKVIEDVVHRRSLSLFLLFFQIVDQLFRFANVGSRQFPDSTRWAMTVCARPPKRLSRSSMKRPLTSLREMANSKM